MNTLNTLNTLIEDLKASLLAVNPGYEKAAPLRPDQEKDYEALDRAYKAWTGAERLPRGGKKLLETAVKEIQEARQAARKVWLLTPEGRDAQRERRARRRKKKKETRIKELVRLAYAACDYRVCDSRWVEDTHRTTIQIDYEPGWTGAWNESGTTWSHNEKWKASTSHHNIKVRPDWERRVQQEGLAVIDGLLTIDAKLPYRLGGAKLYQAKWVRQTRGAGITREDGFIAVSEDGIACHGGTEKAALRNLRRRAEQVEGELSSESLMDHADLPVRLTHARKAGLCLTGIKDFLGRHFPDMLPYIDDPDASIPVGALLTAAVRRNDRVDLVRRACRIAIQEREAAQ